MSLLVKSGAISKLTSLLLPFSRYVNSARGMKRWQVATLKVMKGRAKRRDVVPQPLRHRRVWSNWNYKCELFSFGKRLNEEFNEETLHTAFTHKSYVEQEEKRRQELGASLQEVSLILSDNSELIHSGNLLISRYLNKYLKYCYPKLPEEGIRAVHDYLLSTEVLSHVSSNIGTPDLILCADFPPEKTTLALTLKAIVGALEVDQGTQRAELFVQDFILTQLIAKDVLDIWDIPNPMKMLTKLLAEQGKSPPEPRLLREAASGTILASYLVGIYVDKELLSYAPGETLAIAQEMAAAEALRKMFEVTLDKEPLPFGRKGHQLQIP